MIIGEKNTPTFFSIVVTNIKLMKNRNKDPIIIFLKSKQVIFYELIQLFNLSRKLLPRENNIT